MDSRAQSFSSQTAPVTWNSPVDDPAAAVPTAVKLPPPVKPVESVEEPAPQMVTVILRPSGDASSDIRRIQNLHGKFISFPGRDRFQFQVYENARGHLIDFPNDTTHVCAELLASIRARVGDENVRVEPITYQ
jgi:hypothetical protein